MSYQPRSVVALSGGRGWLTAEAAASIHRIDAQIGHRLQITEAGRSFFQQEEHWLRYLRNGYPIALNPNTPSVHQIGDAIDSDEAQRILAVMEDHGWRRTVYRWVNGVWTLVERWHFEYFIAKDNHRFDGAPSGGATTPVTRPNQSEEDEMPDSMFAIVDGVPSWCWLNWGEGGIAAVHTQAEADWIGSYMGSIKQDLREAIVNGKKVTDGGSELYKNKLAFFGILCPKATIKRGALTEEEFARLEGMVTAGVRAALAGVKS